MVEAIAILLVSATTVFHCVTYLLFVFERRAHGPPAPAQPFTAGIGAWLAEGLTLFLVVITWPLGLIPASRPTGGGQGPPVVLVHGWSLNRASMALLAARLRNDGRTVFAINYRTRGVDMDARAAEVASKFRDILDLTGVDRVDVVAHSAGGVVMRAVARYHGGTEFLANVVSLGSPHNGTALAYLSRAADLMQLRPNSAFLQRLGEDDRIAESVNFTAISSTFDAIVFNDTDSDYPGGLNISLEYIGHHVLLLSPDVYILIKENLAE